MGGNPYDHGIRLYELRRLSPVVETRKNDGPSGSSSSSLHAKTFSVDRARIFIGSFHFDPRSAELNTELGFVIDSPALAREIENAFSRISASAYEVRLSDDGSFTGSSNGKAEKWCAMILSLAPIFGSVPACGF